VVCTTGLPNSCSECYNPYYLLLAATSCFSTCPDYYYDQLANYTCQACSRWCLRCLNDTYCSAC
jgi:hypothetical protein